MIQNDTDVIRDVVAEFRNCPDLDFPPNVNTNVPRWGRRGLIQMHRGQTGGCLTCPRFNVRVRKQTKSPRGASIALRTQTSRFPFYATMYDDKVPFIYKVRVSMPTNIHSLSLEPQILNYPQRRQNDTHVYGYNPSSIITLAYNLGDPLCSIMK